MEGRNTAQSIMTALEKFASQREAIDWNTWMEGAAKLCALLQAEEEHLAEMEHTLIRMKAAYIEDGRPANQAKLLVEQDDLFLKVLKQRAFVRRCDETIRLAKKMATLTHESYFLQK